jgi:FtsZ-binding cell division protein ZapB
MQANVTATGAAQGVQQAKKSAGAIWGPRLMAGCRGIAAALRYIFFFQWVVDLARWLVTTGGNIAESAFLLATVYVTINTVAHQLVMWLLPAGVVVTLNQISVIAFSVLPELIIFAAIKVTFDHFKMALSSKRVDSWLWFCLYVLPTLVFLALTIITISSFVSVEATTTTAPQATGVMLVVRCLAGWSYGMLQMLWVKLGHEGYSNLFARLRSDIAALTETVKLRDGSIAGLEQEKARLTSEAASLRDVVKLRDASLLKLQEEVSNQARALKGRDDRIALLQSELEDLKEQCATLDAELIDTRIALAGANRKVKQSDNSSAPDDEMTSGSPVVTTGKYQLICEHMQAAILRGERVNMRKIASDTGVHYNTVRRHAQSIIDELARNTDKVRVVRSA